jgi:ribosomal protein S27AE
MLLCDQRQRGEGMTAKRENYSESERVSLVTQVNSICPRCGINLFYKKGKRTFNRYELAHIYPLNPKQDELDLLRHEKRLHEDVNHPDNLIPLCGNCHGVFDKPRTIEEYRELFDIKQELIRNEQQASLRMSYDLEIDVSLIVLRLSESEPMDFQGELSYDPKSLVQKLQGDVSPPLRQKIRHNVGDYYHVVRSGLLSLEEENPGVSDLILAQVRSFYLKQKALGFQQERIFANVVKWMAERTKPKTIEAAEILASFFVQNCEVFE